MAKWLNRLRQSNLGCHVEGIYGCLGYGDDAALLTPTVMRL